MNLYLRLVWLWLFHRDGAGASPLAPSLLSMRVWLNDLDVFGHVNNGRYLTLMDLGRLHLAMRTGLLGVMRRRSWHAAASAVEIRFRRPLKFAQRYTLTTEIVDWDEVWFLFGQRFESAGKVVAEARVQAQFRRGRERVPTAEALEAIGAGALRPPGDGRLAGSPASALDGDGAAASGRAG